MQNVHVKPCKSRRQPVFPVWPDPLHLTPAAAAAAAATHPPPPPARQALVAADVMTKQLFTLPAVVRIKDLVEALRK